LDNSNDSAEILDDLVPVEKVNEKKNTKLKTLDFSGI